MARRANGEGSLHKRNDGRWAAYVRPPGGKVKWYYAKTRADAKRKLDAALRALDEGRPVATGTRSLASFMAEWLIIVEPSLRPGTWRRYEEITRLHVLPALGHVHLDRLTPQDFQRLYADRLAVGLSPATVLHIHAVMRRALSHAMKWDLVMRNVVALVDPPRVARRQMQTFTLEEARRFLSFARHDRFDALWVLAVTTGMRQGEVLALHWPDIDLDGAAVQVRGSIRRTRDGYVIAEPKNGRSRRVAITDVAADALRRHRVCQLQERLAAGPHWDEHDLVFATTRGTPMDARNLVNKWFIPLLFRARLPHIRFHDLRHTAATLLLGEGVHPKVVSEMLGHSQVAITLDLYSHVTPTMQATAVRALEDALR